MCVGVWLTFLPYPSDKVVRQKFIIFCEKRVLQSRIAVSIIPHLPNKTGCLIPASRDVQPYLIRSAFLSDGRPGRPASHAAGRSDSRGAPPADQRPPERGAPAAAG